MHPLNWRRWDFWWAFNCYSVRTELVGQGAISRLAISQADIRHSGVYTCAVSDNISQSLRLHIIDGKSIPFQKSKYSCPNSFFQSPTPNLSSITEHQAANGVILSIPSSYNRQHLYYWLLSACSVISDLENTKCCETSKTISSCSCVSTKVYF